MKNLVHIQKKNYLLYSRREPYNCLQSAVINIDGLQNNCRISKKEPRPLINKGF